MAISFTAQTPVDHLIPYANNARTHSDEQVAQVAASIREFGFTNPILIDEQYSIIAGHGRLAAARKLGLDTVPTIQLEGLSEAQKKAYVIADNQLALNAGWDVELLKVEIDELVGLDFDTDLLGFDDDFMADLLDDEPAEGLTDDDEVPEPPAVPVTVAGDVWILGNHRLMCGDSTDADSVARLMDGAKADICFTSPPYNAALGSSLPNKDKYRNNADSSTQEEYKQMLLAFTRLALNVTDYVFCNVQMLAGNKIALIEYMHELREVFADSIVWDKGSAEPAMARKVLNSRFEFVHIFSNDAKRSVGSVDFRGTLDNVISLSSKGDKQYSSIHKATFPVAFAEFHVTNFAENSVYEPFGGSGTTLIACEKTNRTCYMMELDPIYCDVIINRWQDYTGRQAVHENGTPYQKSEAA